MGRKRIAVWACCTLVTASVTASVSGKNVGADTSDDNADSSQSDPRSGAALNREAALDPGPPQAPIYPDISPTDIRRRAVNNPAADTTAQDTQSETSVAVSGNNVIVGWNDSGSLTSAQATTSPASVDRPDLGATFTDKGALPNSTEGDAGDPVLATDASGNVYMVTLGFTTGENLQVFKSTNGGATFGPPSNATPGVRRHRRFPGQAVDGDQQLRRRILRGDRGVLDALPRRRRIGDPALGILRRASTGYPSVLVNTGGQGCHVSWGRHPGGGGNTMYVFYYQGTGPGGQGGDNKLFVDTFNETGAVPAARSRRPLPVSPPRTTSRSPTCSPRRSTATWR